MTNIIDPTTTIVSEARPAPHNGGAWAFWAMAAAFGTYFCMYGFRKPFGADTYDGVKLWHIDFKVALVIAQTLGYTLSKFIGIKAVSEVSPKRRAVTILVLIGIAEGALLLFAVVPRPWNVICLFINGLPLGIVFGLVLGFLEGRRTTELLTAVLCCSFILAGGVTKSVGTWLLETCHVAGPWMPFCAGLIFLMPLLVCVWMLTHIPPPDAQDVDRRAERATMDHHDRSRFFRRYAPGLLFIGTMFGLVTIIRSIRDDFAPEIWKGLGLEKNPAVFTQSELIVGLSVCGICALGIFIRSNRQAFFSAVGIALTGLVLVAVTLIGLSLHLLAPFPFMVLMGVGLYLPYVTVHTTIFERLVAMTRDRATIGYLMYLVDAWGYLGYVAVMLCKRFLFERNFLGFFTLLCWVASGVGIACMIGCWLYFNRRSAGYSWEAA